MDVELAGDLNGRIFNLLARPGDTGVFNATEGGRRVTGCDTSHKTIAVKLIDR
jgi:hypothetical protein